MLLLTGAPKHAIGYGEEIYMAEVEKEELLVEALKTGSREAFDSLYNQYKNLAFKTAYFISGNRQDAEDIVQDTFIKVWTGSSGLRENSGFKAWMMRILVHNAYRAAKRRKREFPDDETVSRLDSRTEPSSLEHIVREEEALQVILAIGNLPVKQRAVVVLYYYNALSVKEIAQMLGVTTGTVKSRLYTARGRIGKELAAYEEGTI